MSIAIIYIYFELIKFYTAYMKILETDRLVITTLTTVDAPFIFELVNSPGWLEFIGDRGIKNIMDAENYIVNGPMASYTTFGHGLYLVALKDNAVAIGICGIIKRDTLEHEDIGFAFLPKYNGKGYALEAASAVLEYAKQILCLKKITAITMEANHRSVSLLAKLGMQYEKTIRLPGSEEELMLFATR
ncbi:MAG: GNAT family N-acetyltransferase [Chitinophagaceae bacterium]